MIIDSLFHHSPHAHYFQRLLPGSNTADQRNNETHHVLPNASKVMSLPKAKYHDTIGNSYYDTEADRMQAILYIGTCLTTIIITDRQHYAVSHVNNIHVHNTWCFTLVHPNCLKKGA